MIERGDSPSPVILVESRSQDSTHIEMAQHYSWIVTGRVLGSMSRLFCYVSRSFDTGRVLQDVSGLALMAM